MSNRQRIKDRSGGSGPRPSAGGFSAFARPDPAFDRRRQEQEHASAMAEQLRYVIDLGVSYVCSDAPARATDPVLQELDQLSTEAAADWLDPRHLMGEEVLTIIGSRWESGWQPDDLLHYLRRTTPRLDDLGGSAVRQQLRRSGLAAKAPPAWQRQLAAIDGQSPPGPSRSGWLFGSGDDPLLGWRRALALMGRLRRMHRLAPVGPPPSQWSSYRDQPTGTAASPPTGGAGSTAPDPGLLGRIRALLAKAESTSFAAEAEALTAKAQELISRHAIDEALLHANAGSGYQVSARRLYIDNPYALTKATLAQSVAEANRVRAVWDEHAGSSTIVGLEADLEQVELLFTSLLVQAVRAMTEEGHGTRSGSVNRSASFRRSFLLAYATRIGERLSETADRVAAEYGAELVPVLARQQQAVDDELGRMFPSISKGGSRTVNLRGWQAGRVAADQAVLPRGRLAQQ